MKVLEQFIRTGIALAKVDSLRGLLEEGALKLTHSSHSADYVPVIKGEGKKWICSEIDDQDVSIIFDGTTWLGETLAVVLRFFSGWKIQQISADFTPHEFKSMTGEEAARELLTVLSTELGIAASHVIAAMRDRAFVNNMAMRTVTIMYQSVMYIGSGP